MRSVKLLLLLTVIFLSTISPVLAEAEHSTSIGFEFAYYFDDNEGYGSVGGFLPISYVPVDTPGTFTPAVDDYSFTESRSLGSGWGSVELQTYLKHRITMPILQGDNFLTADNNVRFNFDLYVAPVAAYARASATITPIAFLNFNLGGMIGTGWNAKIFNGAGKNVNGRIITDSFPGAVIELFSSATLQFDLAAVIPGEWNHVVAQVSAKFLYSYFTAAGDGEPWQWLADSGENLNGSKFEGTYFLGYQMPLVLDTVGFLVETSHMIGSNNLLSPMSSGGWGSDFVEVTFGPLANFSFDEHSSLAVLIQFQTGKDYTDGTIFNQYFMNRVYEATYVKFNRIALAYNYKF